MPLLHFLSYGGKKSSLPFEISGLRRTSSAPVWGQEQNSMLQPTAVIWKAEENAHLLRKAGLSCAPRGLIQGLFPSEASVPFNKQSGFSMGEGYAGRDVFQVLRLRNKGLQCAIQNKLTQDLSAVPGSGTVWSHYIRPYPCCSAGAVILTFSAMRVNTVAAWEAEGSGLTAGR